MGQISNHNSNLPLGTIQFTESHRPSLSDGDYQISVRQTLLLHGMEAPVTFTSPTYSFSVLGPRFRLDPREISGVFPPKGGLGEYFNVLPHVVLSRGTLPWERLVDGETLGIPWLAVLVFADGEEPELESRSLSELVNPSEETVRGPVLSPETGSHDDDPLPAIDVSVGLLRRMLPSRDELPWLTHLRRPKTPNGDSETEPVAVVTANRLPREGASSTAHLVSLEGVYQTLDSLASGTGTEIPSEDSLAVRLVSLHSWSFSSVTETQSFRGLLLGLDRRQSNPTLPVDPRSSSYVQAAVRQGFVPVPHRTRQGNSTMSWYHGPFVAGVNTHSSLDVPVRSADELVFYNEQHGVFDVSYSAAWGLGRLLALQSRDFSVQLFHWKRNHAQQLRMAEDQVSHLPLAIEPARDLELPQSVRRWFTDHGLLKHVPFNYLVPREEMLPKESIRFFHVDPLWIDALLDGAFSIGRVSAEDHAQDGHHEDHPAANPHGEMTGLLLRSDVVSGWPDLRVDGYGKLPDPQGTFAEDLDTLQHSVSAQLRHEFEQRGLPLADQLNVEIVSPPTGKPPGDGWRICDTEQQTCYLLNKDSDQNIYIHLPLLRCDRVSPNVLLCLFQGEIEVVDIHQAPEVVHSGLDSRLGTSEGRVYFKVLRDADGRESPRLKIDKIPWRHGNAEQRVLNINDGRASLVEGMKSVLTDVESFTPAHFAFQMIEGVEMVRFLAEPTPTSAG